MKVLVIGSGAREHAIAWKLVQSDHVTEILSLPGNPGLAQIGGTIEGVDPTDVGAVAAMARIQAIDFVVVGPEAPLAAGVVDALAGVGIPAFGPTRAAARLESSKSFAKDLMNRAGVPTPEAWTFEHAVDAETHIRSHAGPYVVKADGLAAGKGVLVTGDREAALDWVARCFDGEFGAAGNTVVIEEFAAGPELSVFAICDGSRAVLLEPARDYKRLRNGDAGPNTGGMGSYSPVELPDGLLERVGRSIIQPTLDQMRQDGHPYVGVLYAGLVLTDHGPVVIEFNCRLGDPETQVVLPRLESDLFEVMRAATSGDISEVGLEWSADSVVNVVLAAHGYPESPRKGDRIQGLEGTDALVFHAGTRSEGRATVTDGGRVLSVLGRGPTLGEARSQAYASVDSVRFSGRQFRTDIGE